MRHEGERPSGRARAAESIRLKQFFADVFGAEVLSTLALRIEAVSDRTRQRRAAIEWTRQSLSRHARISYTP
jgi:hypothetical protein